MKARIFEMLVELEEMKSELNAIESNESRPSEALSEAVITAEQFENALETYYEELV